MNVFAEWFSILRVSGNYKTMHYYAGGTDLFNINFVGGYIDFSHVKCIVSDGIETTLTYLTTGTVRTNRVIPADQTILIYRDTPNDVPLAQFVDGAVLNSPNLDRNAKQAIFVSAEVLDRFDTFGSSLETSVSQVSEALAVAQNAQAIASASNAVANDAKALATQALEVVRNHNDLLGRSTPGAHPASAISWDEFGTTAEAVGKLRADLLNTAGTGGDQVKSRHSAAGAVTRSLNSRVRDTLCITDFDDGAIDDGAYNCFDALYKAATFLAALGGSIRFPKKSTGVYRIVGSDTRFVDMSGIEFIVDEGVSFAFEGSWTPLIVKGLKVNRQVPVKLVNAGYTFYHGKNQYANQSDASITLTQQSGTYEVPVPISGTNFSAWILDQTVGGRAPATPTATTDSVTIPFNATTQRNVASFKSRIGDEVSMHNASTEGSVVVGVLTQTGYCLVEQNLSNGATVLNTNGTVATVYNRLPTGQRNQFNSGVLSVRQISATKFSVMVNHISVGTFDAGSSIVAVAFGGHTRTTSMLWTNPSRVRNSKASGSRPLHIIALGDSTSDPAIPCSQYDHMKRYLASAGCPVFDLRNLAVSGQNSSQQLAALLAAGSLIAGCDFVIANVGINDIQGGVSPDTYAANVLAMHNHCKSQGVQFILSLPLTWYSKAEALVYGQTGQDTANNSLGAVYRQKAIRALAGTGALVSTAPVKNMGLTSAAWLTSGSDPILMDNIHPTAYGRMMMALGNAQAILGAINPVGYGAPAFETLAPRMIVGSPAQVPSVRFEDGQIRFSGGITVASGVANGTKIVHLDPELKPIGWCYFNAACAGASGITGACQIAVDPTGALYVYNVPAGSTLVTLDSVVIPFNY